MAESTTRFLGNDESLGKTIQTLEGRLDGFGTSVAGVGTVTSALPAKFAAVAVGVAALAAGIAGAIISVNTFKTALDFVEKLDNLKAQTGATRGELVLLQRAFELTGSSAEKVGPAMNKVQELIAKAGDNSPKAVEKLGLLGLKFDELNKLSPAQQFERVMEAIDAIPNPAERARAAMAVFGNSLGRELLPLIKDFDGGMAAAAKTLGSLPGIIEKYGPSMSMFGNAIDALKEKPNEFAVGVVGPMSTLLGNLAQKFAEFDVAGFGEAIGLALNDAMVSMLVWAERGYKVLQGVWDGLEPGLRPVLDDLGKAWDLFVNSLKPVIDRIGAFFSSIDYTAIGKRIGDQFTYALDVARGIFEDPSKIFSLYGKYLDFTFRKAADDFVSFFVTGAEVLGRALLGILGANFWESIGKIFAGALILGVAQINLKFLEMIESVMRTFTGIWNLVTAEGVASFAKRLFEMIKNFGSDFVSVLTNPIGFFTGKLTSALISSSKSGADAFAVNYDKAAGGMISKAKAGLEGMSTSATQTMGEGFKGATAALTKGVSEAVTKTEGFKSNIFGSAEAGQRLKQSTDELAKNGSALRTSAEGAATAIGKAKGDVKAAVDLTTGPGGIATATKEAATATQKSSSSITTAYGSVARSGQDFTSATSKSGRDFTKAAADAGVQFSKNVQFSLKALTDSMRGFATETTLREAVSQLREIKEVLNRPVLV